jgi:hypothetical protein
MINSQTAVVCLALGVILSGLGVWLLPWPAYLWLTLPGSGLIGFGLGGVLTQ